MQGENLEELIWSLMYVKSATIKIFFFLHATFAFDVCLECFVGAVMTSNNLIFWNCEFCYVVAP